MRVYPDAGIVDALTKVEDKWKGAHQNELSFFVILYDSYPRRYEESIEFIFKGESRINQAKHVPIRNYRLSFQKIGVDEISSKFIHRLKGDRDLCFQIGIILCVFFDTRNLIGNYSSDNLSIDRIFMKFMLYIYIYILSRRGIKRRINSWVTCCGGEIGNYFSEYVEICVKYIPYPKSSILPRIPMNRNMIFTCSD